MLAQAVALDLYEVLTSFSHDLPHPLPALLGAIARMCVMNVAVYEKTL